MFNEDKQCTNAGVDEVEYLGKSSIEVNYTNIFFVKHGDQHFFLTDDEEEQQWSNNDHSGMPKRIRIRPPMFQEYE